MKKTPIYDVFLSRSLRDAGLANLVLESLTACGLSVFDSPQIAAGEPIGDAVRDGLVDSIAVVLLVTPSSNSSRNMAFEAGMAMAWDKPIFVLYDGVSQLEIPDFLRQFKILPLSEVANVSKQILGAKQSLTPEQSDILARIYSKTGIATDRLLVEPTALKELSDRFRSEAGLNLSGSRIAQELIRMRKQGRLPKIKMKPLTHST